MGQTKNHYYWDYFYFFNAEMFIGLIMLLNIIFLSLIFLFLNAGLSPCSHTTTTTRLLYEYSPPGEYLFNNNNNIKRKYPTITNKK